MWLLNFAINNKLICGLRNPSCTLVAYMKLRIVLIEPVMFHSVVLYILGKPALCLVLHVVDESRAD